MIDSVSGIANVAMAMQQQKVAQQIDIAVFNKAQDIQKQQGEQVLQLLDSAQVAPTGIDVRA